jgi:uncharacterized membrane protein
MSYFHPMVVHFPIALIFVTFALDLLGKILKREKLLYAGTVVAMFATAGAVAALFTGLVAEDTGWHPASVADMLETHELMGYITMGIVAVMLIVRLALRDKLHTAIGWLIVALGGLAVISVSYGGYLGGEMVYTHGTAVKAYEQCYKDKATLENEIKTLEQSEKQPAAEQESMK